MTQSKTDSREESSKKAGSPLRFFVFMALCLTVFVGVIAAAVFFTAVRGAEETMVPDVRGKELTDALLELQEKELYPKIYLRYSQSSHDKGTILEQDPAVGTIVKAGRRINLVVSQGVVVNVVENYINRNISDVRMEIQTLFTSTAQPLLFLKEPFMYEYAPEPVGTILQQKPAPGTGITGRTALEFVVSQGPENAVMPAPSFVGMSMDAALAKISRLEIDFAFTLRYAQAGERVGTVVFQDPEADTAVNADTRVYLTVASPTETDTDDEQVFSLFTYAMPQNPYPLATRLEALIPSGERRDLIAVPYRGGEFTVPYHLPVGSLLILSILNREIHREVVIGSREMYPSY
ncbi:MAG: PASTA domain-containing protein [Spirochaetaceae bacterium]|jgi:beta-lactam-binding protein with PASTA domain|nr:PASTA domain-containing protein [Spirochaetaceae bacterium]